jgi:hypothetical protein
MVSSVTLTAVIGGLINVKRFVAGTVAGYIEAKTFTEVFGHGAEAKETVLVETFESTSRAIKKYST